MAIMINYQNGSEILQLSQIIVRLSELKKSSLQDSDEFDLQLKGAKNTPMGKTYI